MPITFNSQGGFLNGTISSSNGNLFIVTSGSAGSINVGNVEYTGSQVIEKDSAGKVRNKKTFNTDGTIKQEKFDQNEKIVETKFKDPSKGKEFFRSASATTNQIEFKQNAAGALVITSGSNPGFVAFMNNVGDRSMRARGDVFLSGSKFCSTGVAMNGSSLDYYIQQQHLGALGSTHTFGDSNGNGFLMVSQSGDTRISKNLIVDSHITASGNISSSGEYLGNQIQIYQANFTDDIGTTTHFIPLGTSTFETTGEDFPAVGLVAPYDGELVKIIYRHSFDASSTTTRFVLSVIPDGTDLDGSPTTRFRGTVTGATTDTIQEVTVADADSVSLDDMFFNKGETIFLSIRNSSDVTTSISTDDFHITVVLKFNVPLGLI